MKESRYLEPSQELGRAFVMRNIPGELVMLNLLRFREVADYSATPELAPVSPISGAEAFQRYIDHTLPYLRQSGGDLLFLGHGGAFLMAGIGHRTAALEDSRLLPLSAVQTTLQTATSPTATS